MAEKWTMESAAGPGPGLHPLAGARLRTFLQRCLFTQGLASRSRKQRRVGSFVQFLRFPVSSFENIKYAELIANEALTKPPIFLIGHWRSGTTHLHNLMSRDPQFGYFTFSETALPLDMMGKKVEIARKFIDRALPETRGYDNVKLTLDEPQEEEMALGNLGPIGYYNIYYFPQQMDLHQQRSLFFNECSPAEIENFRRNYEFLIKKLSVVKNHRQLLLKNPPSTTRMPLIKDLFPNAKFIHIVRDPWPVFSSSVGKFPRLFNAFAWQDFDKVDVEGFTLRTYEQVMHRYLEDREKLALPSNQLYETSYEKITANPVGEIGKIYDALELDGKQAGLEKIAEYAATLKDYKRNVHNISESHAKEIRQRWRFSFEEWGYDPDADLEVSHP